MGNLSLEHWRFVFFEFSQTRLALVEYLRAGRHRRDRRHDLVTLVGYLSMRKLVWGHRYLAFLATAPVAIPGIVLAVGLFLSYTHPPLVLYGTLWIIFLAYVTKELPVGYQQVATSLKSVHPELEDASRIFGATRLRALSRHHRAAHPQRRDRHLDLHLHRLDPRAVGDDPAVDREDEARLVIIYDLHESGDLGAISVLGLLLLAVTFVVVWAANRLPVLGGERRRPGQHRECSVSTKDSVIFDRSERVDE